MHHKHAIDVLECIKTELTKFNHPTEELMLKDALDGKEAGGAGYYMQKELLQKYEAAQLIDQAIAKLR